MEVHKLHGEALLKVSKQDFHGLSKLEQGVSALETALAISEELKVDEEIQDQISRSLNSAKRLNSIRATKLQEQNDQRIVAQLKE